MRIRNRPFQSLLILLALTSASAHALPPQTPDTKLVLVGGGTRPAKAMEMYAGWAGGAEAKVLIIGWSSTIPEDYFTSISGDLRKQGVTQFLASLHRPEPADVAAFTEDFLSKLSTATAVFFSGGDQKKHMAVIDLPRIREAIVAKFKSGTPFAGTSAGTAIMSDPMFSGKGSETIRGLGLLPGFLVDQHSRRPDRDPRMIDAMERYNLTYAFSTDENHSVVVLNGTDATVVGPHHATFYHRKGPGQIERTKLFDRDGFNLREWKARPFCPSLLDAPSGVFSFPRPPKSLPPGITANAS